MMTGTASRDSSGAQLAQPPKAEDQLAIMHLTAAYVAHADGAGRGEPADLFVKDGVLSLGSLRLENHSAIQRFFEDRARDNRAQGRVTRHVPGPLEITAVEHERLEARSTAIVFAGNGDLPLATALPTTICDFNDVFVLTSDGWRFASRTATVVFTGAGAATFAK